MANVYSTRFLAWAASELPPAYVVPTGYVAVVRDADVYSAGGEIINWRLGVNTVAIFAAGAFTIIAEAQTAEWRGRQVLEPGDELYFQSDGPTDGLVSGYLLGLP